MKYARFISCERYLSVLYRPGHQEKEYIEHVDLKLRFWDIDHFRIPSALALLGLVLGRLVFDLAIDLACVHLQMRQISVHSQN